VISHTTARFRKAYRQLPVPIRKQAKVAYKLFQQNPHHPSLRFKQVHPTRPIYSVRAGLDYQAVGVREGETLIWFWIGSHADYDRLLAQMR
jgi:hypothetical protein